MLENETVNMTKLISVITLCLIKIEIIRVMITMNLIVFIQTIIKMMKMKKCLQESIQI